MRVESLRLDFRNRPEAVLRSLGVSMKSSDLVLVAIVIAGIYFVVPEYTFTTPADFRQACKETHVRFHRQPSEPVTSLLWQQLPELARDVTFRGYAISGNRELRSAGTMSVSWQPFLKDYVPVYSPRQRSADERKAGLAASGYIKTYKGTVVQDTGPASFDAMVTYTISPESSLKSAGRWMPMATHSLQVTDLRSNELLSEMVFVIDRKRGLACGVNMPGAVNMDVFVLQATNLVQNVVPPEPYAKRWVMPKTQYGN